MRAVKTKAPLKVQFLLTWGGESKKLRLYLVKSRGREGSIESQTNVGFFSYDGTPNYRVFTKEGHKVNAYYTDKICLLGASKGFIQGLVKGAMLCFINPYFYF